MENILWKEELEGKHVCVVLSGDDQIVDAGEVRKYFTGGEEERRWEKGGLEVFFLGWIMLWCLIRESGADRF